MLKVVVSVVFVSVEGDGGGCFVSSCGWFAMFFFNYRDATRIVFWNIFLDRIIFLLFV
jgi:hypothetical protein